MEKGSWGGVGGGLEEERDIERGVELDSSLHIPGRETRVLPCARAAGVRRVRADSTSGRGRRRWGRRRSWQGWAFCPHLWPTDPTWSGARQAAVAEDTTAHRRCPWEQSGLPPGEDGARTLRRHRHSKQPQFSSSL